MSFATLEDMNDRRKHPDIAHTGMVKGSGTLRGPTPEYEIDRDETLNPSLWDVRHWSWRSWAILIAGLILVVVIVVIVVVEVMKKDKYPDYSALTYSLADTCESP